MDKQKVVFVPDVSTEPVLGPQLTLDSRNDTSFKIGILQCNSGNSRISSKFNLSPNQYQGPSPPKGGQDSVLIKLGIQNMQKNLDIHLRHRPPRILRFFRQQIKNKDLNIETTQTSKTVDQATTYQSPMNSIVKKSVQLEVIEQEFTDPDADPERSVDENSEMDMLVYKNMLHNSGLRGTNFSVSSKSKMSKHQNQGCQAELSTDVHDRQQAQLPLSLDNPGRMDIDQGILENVKTEISSQRVLIKNDITPVFKNPLGVSKQFVYQHRRQHTTKTLNQFLIKKQSSSNINEKESVGNDTQYLNDSPKYSPGNRKKSNIKLNLNLKNLNRNYCDSNNSSPVKKPIQQKPSIKISIPALDQKINQMQEKLLSLQNQDPFTSKKFDHQLMKKPNFLYPFKQQNRSKLTSKNVVLDAFQPNFAQNSVLNSQEYNQNISAWGETYQTFRAKGGKSTITVSSESPERNGPRMKINVYQRKEPAIRSGCNVINLLDFDNQQRGQIDSPKVIIITSAPTPDNNAPSSCNNRFQSMIISGQQEFQQIFDGFSTTRHEPSSIPSTNRTIKTTQPGIRKRYFHKRPQMQNDIAISGHKIASQVASHRDQGTDNQEIIQPIHIQLPNAKAQKQGSQTSSYKFPKKVGIKSFSPQPIPISNEQRKIFSANTGTRRKLYQNQQTETKLISDAVQLQLQQLKNLEQHLVRSQQTTAQLSYQKPRVQTQMDNDSSNKNVTPTSSLKKINVDILVESPKASIRKSNNSNRFGGSTNNDNQSNQNSKVSLNIGQILLPEMPEEEFEGYQLKTYRNRTPVRSPKQSPKFLGTVATSDFLKCQPMPTVRYSQRSYTSNKNTIQNIMTHGLSIKKQQAKKQLKESGLNGQKILLKSSRYITKQEEQSQMMECKTPKSKINLLQFEKQLKQNFNNSGAQEVKQLQKNEVQQTSFKSVKSDSSRPVLDVSSKETSRVPLMFPFAKKETLLMSSMSCIDDSGTSKKRHKPNIQKIFSQYEFGSDIKIEESPREHRENFQMGGCDLKKRQTEKMAFDPEVRIIASNQKSQRQSEFTLGETMTFGEQIPITSPNSNTKSGFSKKSMRLVYRGKSNGSLGQRLLNLYK